LGINTPEKEIYLIGWYRAAGGKKNPIINVDRGFKITYYNYVMG